MSKYTPTTDEMRFAWSERVNKHNQEGSDEFDRWFTAELRKAKAEAWDEGFAAGVNTDMGDYEHPPEEFTNPYRGARRAPHPLRLE